MKFVGHQKIADFLDRSLTKNKIAGAYLFSGIRGLGKFALAKEFAKKIGGFFDQSKIDLELKLIEPEKEEKKGLVKEKEIKIGAIRELEKFLSLTPGRGKRRVVIINDAEKMNLSAQNALLKTLEEPPRGAVVILVAHDEKKIISTVKSRCIHKKFWPAGELSENLRSNKSEIFSSGMDEIFSLNISEKADLAEKISGDAAKLIKIFEAWILELREIILGKKVDSRIKKEKAIELIQEAQVSVSIIKDTNSNPRIILENWLFKI